LGLKSKHETYDSGVPAVGQFEKTVNEGTCNYW